MMRTHRAGDLRAEHVGADGRRCADGSRTAATTAAWCSSTSATPPGSCRSSSIPSRPGCEAAHRVRSEWVLRVDGHRCGPGPRAPSTPTCRPARSRSVATRDRGVERSRAAAVPARRARRRRRGAAPAAPLPRPAARADAAQPARARRGQPRDARGDARAGLRRGRDADAHRVDAGRRARLRRAVAPAARLVLRAAAEPAAVQAAADGRRPRPLLPDRALPPRRRPARRSPVRVHAARRRDELRRSGRRARRRCRSRCSRRPRSARPGEAPADDPAHDLARSDGALRLRQARHALRHGAGRAHRGVRGDRVPRVRGRRGGQGDLRRRARATSVASKLDALTDRAKSLGAPGLVWMRVRDGGVLESPVVEVPLRGRAARHRRRARARSRAISC